MIASLLFVSFVALLNFGGSSGECNIACPAVYKPICADCNGEMKTFSNTCQMNSHNLCNHQSCKFLMDGMCNTGCNKICTLDLRPVCASNGRQLKTFSNNCSRIAFNECYNDSYDVIANCACEDRGTRC